ncbi:GGDEF domain-containing protein [Blastococcus montanus]|uniref:GGDEF domain-containing protein n=1 Tax=Blastococcus montanus TaxID=3144973 RepID=UPI003207CE3D
MYSGQRTPTSLLAALYAICGVLCWIGAALPMHPETPVRLLWALGAVGLGAGAGLWWGAARLRPWVLHVALALVSVLVGVLAWRSATAVGVIGLGPVQISVGLYAAHFFSLPAARLHAAFAVLCAGLGAWAAAPSGFLAPWIALAVSVAALTEAQGRLARRLRTAAGTDPLTGIANRRAWEEQAARHLARAARSGEPLSFAILDLDDFKEVNDRDGHSAGDDLLRELTATWSRRLRKADLLGRYGGDEFVLLLPATDDDGARQVMDQLDATHPFTWTVGLATARPGDTLDTVLARADAQLYRRKRGRIS